MKYLNLIALFLLTSVSAQQIPLPEFNDKPAYYNEKEKKIRDLEKSQYNTMAKATGLFSAEAGFFMNSKTSPVKIARQESLRFVIKVKSGTDPEAVLDLVKFEVRGDKRVFMTAKAKASGSSNSFEKIPYEIEKIKDGYYYLIVKNLQKGEYFFGSNDAMFAFAIE